MYGADRMMSQSKYQISGTNAHKNIDGGRYSSRSDVLQGTEVYCERYGIAGKIDLFYIEERRLVERKKRQSVIYKGLIFQLYAQSFALEEMGYEVDRMEIRSLDDNRTFAIGLPRDNPEFVADFEETLNDMRTFDIGGFQQPNLAKCEKCIYAPMCGNTDIS